MSGKRLGLALSGGGFRASFFHIGVLARMAEMDLLRDVEAISTVSGGSIIGALYYLRLKQLLESKADADITQHDYIDMVQTIEAEFLAAVQKNIRWRTFSSVLHNLKMVLPNYSRSDRIGELYDELIYRAAWHEERDTPIMMHELKIQPKGYTSEEPFNPTKGHNAERRNKVPVLNINATVLNTGHNWRFTASYMGEVIHDDALSVNIDKNTRLLGGRYEDIHSHNEGFPLGIAVAASACVPGLFPPLSISNMYQSPWRVQLVDGGVYDNQGLESLRDAHFYCSDLIISDASGQMRDIPSPDTRAVPVLGQVTEVLLGRVRDEMIAQAVHNNGASNVALMHMTDGLPVMFMPHLDVNGSGGNAPRRDVDDPVPQLDRDTRGRISRIRTDLDSFTDTEAYSIMALGYAYAQVHVDAFAKNWRSPASAAQVGQWRFSVAEAWLKQPASGPGDYTKQLDVAEQKFLKPYRMGMTPALAQATAIFSGSLLGMFLVLWGVAALFVDNPLSGLWTYLESVNVIDIAKLLLIVGLLALLGRFGKAIKALSKLTHFNQMAIRVAFEALVPALAAIPVKVYLLTIDKYFVRSGKYPPEGPEAGGDQGKPLPPSGAKEELMLG